jgi:uncharacterized surface protein with fasciclin (FAS1) repeats/sporulation protein YlmC with PRC-barrel domain
MAIKATQALAVAAAGALVFASGAFAQDGTPEQRDQQQQQQQSQPEREPQQEAQQERSGESSEQQRAEGQGAQALEQIAEQNDDLSTFVRALRETGLADAVQQREYTAFAPTNEAFEQIGNVDELMRPENRAQLTEMLRDHLVVGQVDSQKAGTLDEALTVSGKRLDIQKSGDELQVNGANVVDEDLRAGSMTIHTVDQVLKPTRTASAPGTEPGQQAQTREQDQARQQAQTREEEQRRQPPQARTETESGAPDRMMGAPSPRSPQARTAGSEDPTRQSQAGGQSSAPSAAAAGGDEHRASELIGSAVTDSSGDEIAEIDDLILSPDGKEIKAVLSTRGSGFLGSAGELVTVPLDELQIQMEGGETTIQAEMSKEELTARPKFDYASLEEQE